MLFQLLHNSCSKRIQIQLMHLCKAIPDKTGSRVYRISKVRWCSLADPVFAPQVEFSDTTSERQRYPRRTVRKMLHQKCLLGVTLIRLSRS